MSKEALDWMFSSELPLPSGLELEVLATKPAELGGERLDEMGNLIGKDGAQELSEKLGAYELGEEQVKNLGLEGVRLGENGEFPALSPAGWGRNLEAATWESMRARLKASGAAIVGLSLSEQQRESFLGFLVRNRVNLDAEAEPEAIVVLARHFFFAEPLNVVVCYTGPRFHHS